MFGWDLDGASHRIDDWQSMLEARAARAQEFAQRAGEVTGSGEDETGLVTARVNQSGQLVDLTVDDRVRAWSGARIAAAVLAATQAAQRAAAAQVRRLSTDMGFGHD